MAIIFAILIFSLLIFVHELGHFITAKMSGVQVNEFAMFMGPAIFKKKIGETTYSIRCIPIGGYCAMEGEDSNSDNPRAFGNAAWWKRLIILVAGSFMNFIAGILIIAVILSFREAYVSTEIVKIEQWSTVGGENGLQVGDKILEFDGTTINIQQDFALETAFAPAGTYDIVVQRNGQRVELHDVLMKKQLVEDEAGNQSMLYGLSFGVEENTAGATFQHIWPTTVNQVRQVVVSLKMLVAGEAGINDVGGPVLIVKTMSDVANESDTTQDALLNMLSIGGLIAINLAVMNMLPIPALDGGRVFALLVTTGIEAVTKKKVNPKYEGYIHAVGMVLLLVLMALIMFKDIFVIIKG